MRDRIDSILIATGNAGKAREFEEMLVGARDDARTNAEAEASNPSCSTNSFRAVEKESDASASAFSVESLKSLDPVVEPEETGATFRANACLKATYYAKHFGRWTLADDSGLAVDALGGSPGVFSARWAERHGEGQGGRGDTANNALLLRQLEGIEAANRSSRFVCVLALADPAGRIVLTACGEMVGQILTGPRGGNGFGYDPLFLADGQAKTTAELSPSEKHAISHRGKALRVLRNTMERERLIV